MIRTRIGITGSRHGWDHQQAMAFIDRLCDTQISEFHFGACVGVDELAFWLWATGGSGVAHAWPATMSPDWDARWRMDLTAKDIETFGVVMHEPMHPLARNKQIVQNCDQLWAFPETDDDQSRSGTWSTIRYARSLDKQVFIDYRAVSYPQVSDEEQT